MPLSFHHLLQKMSDLSGTLLNHLRDSAKKGSPSAVLFAQIAFFPTTIFLWKTRLCAEHDSTGIIVALSYQIISAVLISNSWRLRQCDFIHVQCGYKLNLIANGFFLILAIVLEKLYEKSLSSLGFALSITVLFLILLVIIQPSTDLGLIGFLIGVIGSVAYNLFGHKFQTWIVLGICLMLLGVRGWLEEKWLKEGVDHQPREDRSSKSEIIEAVAVAIFHLFWILNLFRINCRKIKGSPKSISCALSSLMGMLACVLIFSLWFGLALVLRVHYLFNVRLDRPPVVTPVTLADYGGAYFDDSDSTEVEDYDSEPEEKSPDYDSEPTEAAGLSHRRRRREPVEDLPPTRRKVEKEDHHPEEKTA